MAAMFTSRLILTFLSLNGLADAYWRMSCSLIQTSRIDPVVSPGQIASHVHKISGASTIHLSSTYDDLINAPCTSCEIQDDKSAYWTPQLYYRHGNGKFEQVPNGGTVVYYLGRGDDRGNVVPFPKGFRMLSGNSNARAYDTTTKVYGPNGSGRLLADRVSFNCLNYAKGNPETAGLPNITCPQGLRAQIHFQSCWDGVNLYKTDNSHVAYLSQIDNGVCPPTHPVVLPHLFFEVLYDTNAITQDGGQLVFSQGDTTGYGFHGDFLNGWDMDVQKAAVQNCLNTDNNGQISACPTLVASQVSNYANICPERPAIVNEQVNGMLQSLPGCNPVTSGPQTATPGVCPSGYSPPSTNPPTQQGPKPSLPAVGTRVGDWQYAGCARENSNGRALTTASYTSDSMTNEACQNFCASKSLPLAGVEFGKECYCGSQLEGDSRLGVDCSKNSMLCAGNSTQFCGGPSIINLWNSTTAAGRTALTVGTKIGSYTYLGCGSEGSSSRALTGASYTNSSGMTNEACGAFCSSKGFSIFGTEYASECYCGNKLNSGSTYPQSGCNMACAGKVDSSSPWAGYVNICGGPSRLSLFNITRS